MEENIFFFCLLCLLAVIDICLAVFLWFTKKEVTFWGKKNIMEATNIKKYHHALSKLYVIHSIVCILLGIPLLAGQSIWISVGGVVIATIIFMIVATVVIEKIYKK